MPSVQAVATAMGGGVRVGLEGYIWLDKKRPQLARNRDLFERVHELAAMCGRPVMSPETLRRKLGLAPGNGSYGIALLLD
jgi:uncharacterized protein (DUF849 family)